MLVMDKEIIEKIAENIKKYRIIKGYTQDDLSFKSGIPRSTIGSIETASNDITITKVNAIAKAFDLKLWQLLKFDD